MNLNQMRHLADDWNLDGAEKPSDLSLSNANKIMEAVNRKVISMCPSVEGGVLIQFKNGYFGVYVECYNDGEIGYTLTHYGKSVESKDMLDQNIASLDFICAIQNHLGQEIEVVNQLG
jgi:hypothetical protein